MPFSPSHHPARRPQNPHRRPLHMPAICGIVIYGSKVIGCGREVRWTATCATRTMNGFARRSAVLWLDTWFRICSSETPTARPGWRRVSRACWTLPRLSQFGTVEKNPAGDRPGRCLGAAVGSAGMSWPPQSVNRPGAGTSSVRLLVLLDDQRKLGAGVHAVTGGLLVAGGDGVLLQV
jgi:hypothetical protein